MSVTITLPEHYGYVVLAAVSTGFLTAWQTSYVSSGRKKAGVKYPQMYAEREQMEKDPEAVRYNCAQRAHQNTLEWLPHVLFFLPFLGLRHPIAAASLGAGWNFGRILYTLGYTTGDPAKEMGIKTTHEASQEYIKETFNGYSMDLQLTLAFQAKMVHLSLEFVTLGLAALAQLVIAHPGEADEVVHPADIGRRQLEATKRHVQARNCAPQIAAHVAARKAKRALVGKPNMRRWGPDSVPQGTELWRRTLHSRQVSSRGDTVISSTDGPKYDSIQNSTCVTAPEVTEGPYYVNNELVRNDVRENQPGVDLFLDIGVIDTTTCQPLSQAFVEIWSCNATGAYAGFTAANAGPPPSFTLPPSTAATVTTDVSSTTTTRGPPPGGPGGPGGPSQNMTDQLTFLRGGAPTNENGILEFKTIYPGFYTGRTIHIHAMVQTKLVTCYITLEHSVLYIPNQTFSYTVFSNGVISTIGSKQGDVHHIGQIFFDESLNDQVLAQPDYLNTTQTRTLDDFPNKQATRLRLKRLAALVLLARLAKVSKVIERRARYRHLLRSHLLPNPRLDTPWQQVRRSHDDQAYLATMGLDVKMFEYILGKGFEELWNTHTIVRGDVGEQGRPRLRRRLLRADGALGLALYWLTSTESEAALGQTFALVPSVLSRYLSFALQILLRVLQNTAESRVTWPSPDQMGEFSELIRRRHPSIHGAFGFMDGLNLPVGTSSDSQEEEATYNGWLHSHRVSNIFVFSPDGCVIACKLNAPGSWHDARIARDVYLKLVNDTPAGFFLIADTAFRNNSVALEGKIRTPLKKGSRLPANRHERRRAIQESNNLTQARQAAEWGMRSLQSVFARLRLPLDINNPEGRQVLLE
ncbi:DDE family endonuclease [Ceratobasidium sp. AG-Ba]|nr:DDE family endonuclease [Ceratobasidium sp. AG-Ba]